MSDDIDGNFPEAVYQAKHRGLTVEERFMFSDEFDLKKETARVLKEIEGYLTDMEVVDRLSHRQKQKMCKEALSLVVDLRRFYTDEDYLYSEEYEHIEL